MVPDEDERRPGCPESDEVDEVDTTEGFFRFRPSPGCGRAEASAGERGGKTAGASCHRHPGLDDFAAFASRAKAFDVVKSRPVRGSKDRGGRRFRHPFRRGLLQGPDGSGPDSALR